MMRFLVLILDSWILGFLGFQVLGKSFKPSVLELNFHDFSLILLSYDELVKREEESRQSRLRKRQDDLRRSSSLPPRMSHASDRVEEDDDGDKVTRRRRRGRDEETKDSFHAVEVPNFEELHETWDKSLREAKRESRVTDLDPFSFDRPSSPRRMKQKKREDAKRERKKRERERDGEKT